MSANRLPSREPSAACLGQRMNDESSRQLTDEDPLRGVRAAARIGDRYEVTQMPQFKALPVPPRRPRAAVLVLVLVLVRVCFMLVTCLSV